MYYYSWLKEFTAFVQLVSAVNFAYIFTHFAERLFNRIFNEEEDINKKFASFRNGQLAKVSQSIESMDTVNINGTDTDAHVQQMKDSLAKLIARWDKAKDKTQSIIQNSKSVKGLKSLFLYISIYCVIDMFNMAIINTVDIRIIQIFVYSVNILAFVYTIFLTGKILYNKWKEKEDKFCFNQTRKYVTLTIILAVVTAIINEFCVYCWGENNIPDFVIYLSLIPCVFLPVYPCLFSVLFIFLKISYVSLFREFNKLCIKWGIWSLNKKKKKYEDAVSVLTSTLNWGTEQLSDSHHVQDEESRAN